jgi:hypothetical protein
LSGSPEDAALIDDVVSIAFRERRRSGRERPLALTEKCILDTDILSDYLKAHNPVVIGHAAWFGSIARFKSTAFEAAGRFHPCFRMFSLDASFSPGARASAECRRGTEECVRHASFR